MKTLFALGVPYLLGSVSFAWLAARLLARRDLRQEGSGNLGALNASRLLGTAPGALVALGDAGKGWLALWLTRQVAPAQTHLLLVAALLVVVGHCFPVWLRFHGGKGLASAIGFSFYLNPWLTLALLAVAATGLALFRRVYPAALLAVVAFPFLLGGLVDIPGRWLAGPAIAAVVFWRHWPNIKAMHAKQ